MDACQLGEEEGRRCAEHGMAVRAILDVSRPVFPQGGGSQPPPVVEGAVFRGSQQLRRQLPVAVGEQHLGHCFRTENAGVQLSERPVTLHQVGVGFFVSQPCQNGNGVGALETAEEVVIVAGGIFKGCRHGCPLFGKPLPEEGQIRFPTYYRRHFDHPLQAADIEPGVDEARRDHNAAGGAPFAQAPILALFADDQIPDRVLL